jgi:hypothetical protein
MSTKLFGALSRLKQMGYGDVEEMVREMESEMVREMRGDKDI